MGDKSSNDVAILFKQKRLFPRLKKDIWEKNGFFNIQINLCVLPDLLGGNFFWFSNLRIKELKGKTGMRGRPEKPKEICNDFQLEA